MNDIGIVVGAIAIIAFIFGIYVSASRFQKDTYDCTVKCPDMAHSIYAYDKCYCEVK